MHFEDKRLFQEWLVATATAFTPTYVQQPPENAPSHEPPAPLVIHVYTKNVGNHVRLDFNKVNAPSRGVDEMDPSVDSGTTAQSDRVTTTAVEPGGSSAAAPRDSVQATLPLTPPSQTAAPQSTSPRPRSATHPPPAATPSVAPSSTVAASTTGNTSSASNQKLPEKHKYVGNYEIIKSIGEGSFATVKLANHRLTNHKAAVKVIDKERLPDDYSKRNIHREAQIMRELDHPNILQLFEVMETRRELFLVLEYAAGGEMLDYIVNHGRLREKEARKFMQQIVSALEYCHGLGIVHRDLKAENLLLDEEGMIKISDFGLSNNYDRSKQLATCCGSPVYSAPELIEGKKYTGPEVDCWSLGVNLYAMVVGDLPFADSNLTALYDAIMKARYHLPDYISSGTFTNAFGPKKNANIIHQIECRDLIQKLLVVNPKQRYTCAQVREHPWMTMGNTLIDQLEAPPKVRPKTEQELDPEILDQLEQMGFEVAAAAHSVVSGKFNQAAGTYYLLAVQKRQDAAKYAKEAAVRKEMIVKRRESMQEEMALRHAAVDGDERHARRESEYLPGGRRNERSTSVAVTDAPSPFPVAAGLVPMNIPGRKLSNVDIVDALAQQQAAVLVPIGAEDKDDSYDDLNLGFFIPNRAPSPPPPQQNAHDRRASKKPLESSTTHTTPTVASHQLPPQTTPGSISPTPCARPRPSETSAHAPRYSKYKGAGGYQSSQALQLPPIAGATHDSSLQKSSNVDLGAILSAVNAPTTLAVTHKDPSGSLPRRKKTVNNNSNSSQANSSNTDASLYIDPSQDTDPTTGQPISDYPEYGQIRIIRYAFNLVATLPANGPSPDTLKDTLIKILLEHEVTSKHSTQYELECEAKESDVKFEVEICKLPKVKGVYGVRMKRLSGDTWDYKNLSAKILTALGN
ncbi:Map microtubule affinity-regulating kinase [Chytridiales sp. JEL 0842]|nr:Map microtubule affinity-regulating kinase [Chytridiales sp. JEL 0842]